MAGAGAEDGRVPERGSSQVPARGALEGVAAVDDDRARQRLILGLILGLGFILGGGYLLYDGVEAVATADEVEATVIDSTVAGGSSPGEATERVYSVEITYEYTYEGETYRNDDVFPEGSADANEFSNRGTAETLVEQYPAGETVTAYVDPDDPDDAHLENEVRLQSVGIFLGLVLMGVVVLGGTARKWLESSSEG